MRAEIVTETDNLSREDWLELRRHGLGGSDAPAVVGVSTWASPYAVYLDKIGALAEPTEKPWMKMGRLLEDVVAAGFEEKTGLTVHRYPVMLRDPDAPFMLANLDRLVGKSVDKPDGLLECKVAVRADKWDDGIPTNYQLQVAHYLAVTGLPRAWVAVLLDYEVQWYEVERDDSLIIDLVEVEEGFWRRVEERRPPPVDGLPSTSDAFGRLRSRAGLEVALPEEARRIIADLRYAKEVTKGAEQRQAELENRLKEMMGEGEIGLLDGQVVFTWTQHERTNLDAKKLRANHPELCAPYESKSPYRTLLLKKEN